MTGYTAGEALGKWRHPEPNSQGSDPNVATFCIQV